MEQVIANCVECGKQILNDTPYIQDNDEFICYVCSKYYENEEPEELNFDC